MTPSLRPKHASEWLPPLAGLALLALFVSLGFWQLERAAGKRDLQASFEGEREYVPLEAGVEYERFTPLKATGRYLPGRQVLLENIVVDGRLGYYVITPFELAPDRPLLLVNRGWLPREGSHGGPRSTDGENGKDGELPIAVDDGERQIRGRAGRLPRVGIRPGPAFADAGGWPRRAVWPETDDVAAVLGREVLPFVLLADPDASSPLLRRWQPQEMGPMRHVGYAVQWFALALATVVIAVVLYRRKRTAT